MKRERDYAQIYINACAVAMLIPLALAWVMGWLR